MIVVSRRIITADVNIQSLVAPMSFMTTRIATHYSRVHLSTSDGEISRMVKYEYVGVRSNVLRCPVIFVDTNDRGNCFTFLMKRISGVMLYLKGMYQMYQN